MADTLLDAITVTGEQTLPSIYIATTLGTTQNTVALSFDYMPENVTFGVSATFNQAPISYTSARWLTFNHSDIEEVSLTVKVVAGCNNCITRFSVNTTNSQFLSNGGLVAGKFKRNTLIVLAQLLYSLPLPSNNQFALNVEESKPPPTSRLIVGKMFSGVGAFTRCSIVFNGPYDYDGSPTDMDVSLGFLPSEFYDSTGFTQMIASSAGLIPKSTPTGESQVTGDSPYALTFGDTQTGLVAAGVVQAAVPEGAPTPQGDSYAASSAAATTAPGTIPGDNVQGPIEETPTPAEVGTLFGYPASSVVYNQAEDYYVVPFNPALPLTDPGQNRVTGTVVRDAVNKQRAGATPLP